MMNNEFKRMQQLAGLTEIKIVPGGTKVYKSVPDNELYKVKNFPQGNMDNARVKEVFEKIVQDLIGEPFNEAYFDDSYLQDFIDDIDALRSRENVYVYIAGDMTPVVKDSLDSVSEGHQTEEEGGVESWEEI